MRAAAQSAVQCEHREHSASSAPSASLLGLEWISLSRYGVVDKHAPCCLPAQHFSPPDVPVFSKQTRRGRGSAVKLTWLEPSLHPARVAKAGADAGMRNVAFGHYTLEFSDFHWSHALKFVARRESMSSHAVALWETLSGTGTSAGVRGWWIHKCGDLPVYRARRQRVSRSSVGLLRL